MWTRVNLESIGYAPWGSSSSSSSSSSSASASRSRKHKISVRTWQVNIKQQRQRAQNAHTCCMTLIGECPIADWWAWWSLRHLKHPPPLQYYSTLQCNNTQAVYYPATTAGDALRCDALLCFICFTSSWCTHFFHNLYHFKHIIHITIYWLWYAKREINLRGGRWRAMEGEGGATGGMVVVTKKERRCAKAVGPKMILPDVQTFRVISSWAPPLSHAFSLSSLP